MGASQFFTTGWIMGRTMGARKAVPSKIARMVPLGLFHISVSWGTPPSAGGWGDGGALHRHAQALGGVGGVDGHLVPRLVPMEQAQVIVLRFQVHEGQDQLSLIQAHRTRVISSPSISTRGVVILILSMVSTSPIIRNFGARRSRTTLNHFRQGTLQRGISRPSGAIPLLCLPKML